MPDYSKGKIYKVTNSLNGKVYIGSTTVDSLNTRISNHRSKSKVRTSKFYRAMQRHGFENFEIDLIKDYPCSSQKELEVEEFKYIQKYLAKGIKLYNDTVEHGNHSTEYREKMRQVKLTRGNVRFEAGTNRWIFQWRPACMVYKKRGFSVNKYGEEEAKAMAYALQDEAFPIH